MARKDKKPEGKKYSFRISMAFNIISAIVVMLILFGLVSCIMGYINFADAMKDEYETSTYHMADTAAILVNGDDLDEYLAGNKTVDYTKSRDYLSTYCRRIYVSLIYVIKVDRSDYGSFESIFNVVNNEVDNTEYTPWELGYKRNTTNDEYRAKYKAIYEEGSPYETIYRFKTTDGQHPHITTMVPVKNIDGEIVAILCMQRPISELYDARKPYIRSMIISTILLALAASSIAVVILRRQVVKPVRKVSDEAVRFARENTLGESLGDISRIKEIFNLASSIDTMEKDMINYVKNLTEVTAEKERIHTEMSLATRIQADMLPNVFPAFPDRSEFDVYASMDPAKEVGGDFYDFFLVDADHLCMVMADVSGKGVPAALFMMASKVILKNNAMMGKAPATILSETNAAICANNREEMFVTVWMGILEISTGTLIMANAGHEYPILKKAGGQFEVFKDKHGFVIGGMAGIKYKECSVQLEPGDKLFVYTDGVPEATNSENELFGMERTISALNECTDASPEDVLKGVRSAVDSFVKDAEQFDDLTMLCMEYHGKA